MSREACLSPGRRRLECLAQRLRNLYPAPFLDGALSASILPRKVTANAPLYRSLHSRSVPAQQRPGSRAVAGTVGSASRPHRNEAARDVSSQDVTVGLHEWRVPMRCYVWGCGTDGQLGCGTVAGVPAFQRASRPLLVNFEFSDPGGGERSARASTEGETEITPIRVACGDRCTAMIDNTRRLYTCGTGWLGHGVDHVDRLRVPTRIASLGSTAVAGARVSRDALRPTPTRMRASDHASCLRRGRLWRGLHHRLLG